MRISTVFFLALVAIFAIFQVKDRVLPERVIDSKTMSVENYPDAMASERPYSEISTKYVIQGNELKVRVVYAKDTPDILEWLD